MEENSIIKDKKDKMLMIVIGCLSVVLILLFIFFLIYCINIYFGGM